MRLLNLFATLILLCVLNGCSVSKQISKQANTILLKDSSISTGHIGICIYEPATNKYWYNYDATHYFIPASNTKLFTLYAGMKYLGDSLVGLRYNNSTSINNIIPTGDPTFLHPDFRIQPVFDFLQKNIKTIAWSKRFINSIWQADALGSGWSWNDYNDDYMAERSPFPIYGNVIDFKLNQDSFYIDPFQGTNNMISYPALYKNKIYQNGYEVPKRNFYLKRSISENRFYLKQSTSNFSRQTIPFVTNGIYTAAYILNDLLYEFEYNRNIKEDSVNRLTAQQEHRDYLSTLKPKVNSDSVRNVLLVDMVRGSLSDYVDLTKYKIIHSQPSDSLFKPMMHRSDNFFAEQTLLMASNEHLGYMNDEKIIDTVLKTDLKDVPQRPKWVDGSGLSRYNLFTPKSFVYILNKMQNEFGLARMKNILATGGEGTLANYFKKDAGFIYAKTGTLSNNCALSGYLITNKGKLLIFSILANNYITGATPIRRAAERFLEGIREKY
ncbi:D-alanyl-D-alanine carboxypeptidase/D-alanyl-D-alanine-endopeptidase [Ferruginibacter sp. SUN106]|uniref:D-alanyl-D-alanine carboxypeptidase/D-alanyl-D-alanine-endopeptidase n=1 Tax=Ferruginibacter sp. SUN106 TaxID=2978348 RepID=UPI003D362D8E